MTLNIDVITTAQQANPENTLGKTAVVIDVLRATSVMVTALNNGAKEVIAVPTPKEAFTLKELYGNNAILGGERNAEKIEGFDFGNSPLSYQPDVVDGKSLIITTSNGTLAINNSLKADELIIASFLNAEAVANYLKTKGEIVFVCSGTNGKYTIEDTLCAGKLINILTQNSNAQLSDQAIATKQLYLSTKDDVCQLAAKGYHYNILKSKGFEQDLKYCFQSDILNIVPKWEEGVIK